MFADMAIIVDSSPSAHMCKRRNRGGGGHFCRFSPSPLSFAPDANIMNSYGSCILLLAIISFF